MNNDNSFIEKMNAVGFQMNNYARLISDGKEYTPLLSNAENTSGFAKDHTILFVFGNETGFDLDKGFDFIYTDEFFRLGINHFVFKGGDLINTPEIIFWNK